jgi:hypothetical protein
LSLSGIQFKILQRIAYKIEKAGATSKKKAVTVEEAKLDIQELNWLGYFAGAFMVKVKKTKDQRYYI